VYPFSFVTTTRSDRPPPRLRRTYERRSPQRPARWQRHCRDGRRARVGTNRDHAEEVRPRAGHDSV